MAACCTRLCALVLVAGIVVLAAGCRGRGGERVEVGNWGEELYSPTCATGFEIRQAGDSSSVIVVRNPWQGALNQTRELFVSRGGEQPKEGFEGQIVGVAPQRVVVFSTSHIAFIDALGLADKIVGVSGAGYVSNATVGEGYRSGRIGDVGYDQSVNYELLASLKPDLVLMYGLSGENRVLTDRLDDMGVAWFYVGDYVENSPLGKAEWVVAVGEIMGCRANAEAVFDGIAERYGQLKEFVDGSGDRPKVMFNAPYGDVWYVPSDESYMVQLVRDAGGDYVCEGFSGSASRAIASEAAYIFTLQADVWLNPNQAATLQQVKEQNPQFALVPAVQNGRVYNCNARHTAMGGSDFWESGALRADVVLADMIAILHPENQVCQGGYYFTQLK